MSMIRGWKWTLVWITFKNYKSKQSAADSDDHLSHSSWQRWQAKISWFFVVQPSRPDRRRFHKHQQLASVLTDFVVIQSRELRLQTSQRTLKRNFSSFFFSDLLNFLFLSLDVVYLLFMALGAFLLCFVLNIIMPVDEVHKRQRKFFSFFIQSKFTVFCIFFSILRPTRPSSDQRDARQLETQTKHDLNLTMRFLISSGFPFCWIFVVIFLLSDSASTFLAICVCAWIRKKWEWFFVTCLVNAMLI